MRQAQDTEMMLAKLDAAHALEFRRLRADAPREAVRKVIADTIVTFQRCRRGTRRLPRRHVRLRPAIDLVVRSLDDNREKPWMRSFETADAKLKAALQIYRNRITFEQRYPMELDNVLILTLAGILRAVTDSRFHYLPAILNAANVRSEAGSKWSLEGLTKRVTRRWGMQMADLAALVPLTKEPRLHATRKSFEMLDWEDVNTCVVLLSPSKPSEASLPAQSRPVAPEEADRILCHELLPALSPLLPEVGVPYLTCCKP